MLLVELTLPSGVVRVSNEPLPLAYFWEPAVASLGQIRLASDKIYGGYVRPRYGNLDLLPGLFSSSGDWPPPVSIPVTIKVTDTDESEAVTLFTGTAHRTDIGRDGIVYNLYGPDYSGTFIDHTYNNTIDGLFAGNIGTADPALTADTTLADGSSAPFINYVDSGEQIVIESLAKTCACATHIFYVEDNVAYLIDMFADNGSRTLTEFDFFPSVYEDGLPYSVLRCGDTDLTGTYSYGKDLTISPVFNTSDTAELTVGLTRIKQILDMPRITLSMPITANSPKPGEKLSWVDTALPMDLSVWMRVRSLVWDFDNEQLVIEGEGDIS